MNAPISIVIRLVRAEVLTLAFGHWLKLAVHTFTFTSAFICLYLWTPVGPTYTSTLELGEYSVLGERREGKEEIRKAKSKVDEQHCVRASLCC